MKWGQVFLAQDLSPNINFKNILKTDSKRV